MHNSKSVVLVSECNWKRDFSVNAQNIKVFHFIFNPIVSLKVTKFLVKISQFWFLVMTEKNFSLQTFFVIKYFRFSFFFVVVVKLQPPLKKFTPLVSSNPPLKVEVLSSPTLFHNYIFQFTVIWILNLKIFANHGGHTLQDKALVIL